MPFPQVTVHVMQLPVFKAGLRLERGLLVPIQNALSPHIDEPHNEHSHEGEHLKEREHTHLLEDDRPGVHEDNFDIEEDEEHRYEVEANVEPLFTHRANWDSTTLPRHLLGLGHLLRPKKRRQ
jgi:hypothetical protein